MTYRYRQVIEEGGGLTYLRHEFGLSPSELFVLDNLIKHDHPRHGCFPKQETIAHETGLPLRTVKAGAEKVGGQRRDRERKAALHGFQRPEAAGEDTPLRALPTMLPMHAAWRGRGSKANVRKRLPKP